MRVKPAILFLISLSLIPVKEIRAEPITLATVAVGVKIVMMVGALGYMLVNDPNPKTPCPCCLGTCSCVVEDPEITRRKRVCARYREAIKDFERTIQENENTKYFYSYTLLAPVAYVRNIAGYDEKLRSSNGQALREIYHFEELLRERYCVGVEKK